MSTPPAADDDIYAADLERCAANHVPLSPLSFLRRSALVFPQRTAVIHGERRHSYAELERRCRRLAAALAGRGIGRGDTVSVMAPNVPAMLEAHYGVPMTGAVLNALNYRLDADGIAFILRHARTRVLITDREFSETVAAALAKLDSPPLVVDIDDPLAEGGALLGETDYERFLAEGDAGWPGSDLPHRWVTPCSAIIGKISLGSTLRRQTCVPAAAVTPQVKHQPLQWNMGSVHR